MITGISIQNRLMYIPNVKVDVDPPTKWGGTWWYNVSRDAVMVIVVWHTNAEEIGVLLPTYGITHQVDQTFPTIDEAVKRVEELLEEEPCEICGAMYQDGMRVHVPNCGVKSESEKV